MCLQVGMAPIWSLDQQLQARLASRKHEVMWCTPFYPKQKEKSDSLKSPRDFAAAATMDFTWRVLRYREGIKSYNR